MANTIHLIEKITEIENKTSDTNMLVMKTNFNTNYRDLK